MNAFVTKNNRAVLEVMAGGPIKEIRGGKFFNSDLLPYDDGGHKYIYPGMVLAESGSYYVPYSSGGSYGTGSDTAVGILREFHDMTVFPRMVAPVTEATFIEAHCYVQGTAMGTISAGIKTALSHIQWK